MIENVRTILWMLMVVLLLLSPLDIAGQEPGEGAESKATSAVSSECGDWQKQHPNWVFCDDFETGDWSRWGHKATNERLLVSNERPCTGKYSMKFAFGELSVPGYQWVSFPKAGLEEVRLRFYIYFGKTFHWGQGETDHCLTFFADGGKTVNRQASGLDLGPWGPKLYRSGKYRGRRFKDLKCNMGKPEERILRNGKWYRLEMHLKLNTIDGCKDKNGNGRIDSVGESDGVFEMWIDDVQVMGYYDLNFRGNDNPDYRITEMLFNHYFRTGGQVYFGKPMTEYRDNLVIAGGDNGGQRIGPVPNEPKDLGTPDPYSPYQTVIYKEWFAHNVKGERIRPGADGTSSVPPIGGWMHNSSPFELVTEPAHNGTKSPFADRIPVGNDKALAAKTTKGRQFSGGGGDHINLPGRGKSAAVHGWMYLDPNCFPAPKGAALSGMIWWAKNSRNYIALGVNAQNHPALLHQSKGSQGSRPVVLKVNRDLIITPGVWHQFEVRGSKNHAWSVLLGGKEILSAKDVDDAELWKTSWAFHYGISDHLENPKPLTVYYDDISIGSTSFEDGWGWNPDVVPKGK